MDIPRADLPDIYTFIDYRQWLAGAFDALRGADPKLTHRSFSKLCGYRSSGAISLILSGKRRLTEKATRRIARVFKLDAAESQHLHLMVAFEQADGFEARERLMRKMQAAQRFAEVWGDTLDAYAFYRDWYLPVLRELTSLPDFREDPQWLAARLHHRLPPKLAAQGLAQLEEIGFLERDSHGALRPKDKIISTSSEVRSDVLKQHQREMMRLASEALDSQPRERRDMRVMTVAISQNQADRIKGLLTLLQKEILAVVEEDEPIEGVFQLNTQWFALTDAPEGSEDD